MYSFEDQKWDAEMKLELEKKKQKELMVVEKGKGEETKDVRTLIKETKLSQKQKVGHYNKTITPRNARTKQYSTTQSFFKEKLAVLGRI